MGGALSLLAEGAVTDEMLITTLGTRLGCVRALFFISWLHILVEVLRTEVGLNAPREQARYALPQTESVTRDETFDRLSP